MPDRPPEPFRCDVDAGDGRVRVIPRGEVDLASVPDLDAKLNELRESGFDRLVLDLAHVTFMDSTGLRLILNWDAEARTDGITFHLLPGPSHVQRLFEIAGVGDRLQFAEPDRP